MKFVHFYIVGLLLVTACEEKKTPVETLSVPPTSTATQTNGGPLTKSPSVVTGLSTSAPTDVVAPPSDASRTESGVSYKTLKPGSGEETPTVDSTITAEYTGWTTDGKQFDSSTTHGKPLVQRLGNLIPGWQQGIISMKKGEIRRMWIPAELGYANSSNPDAPKGMLVFEVTLVDFK